MWSLRPHNSVQHTDTFIFFFLTFADQCSLQQNLFQLQMLEKLHVNTGIAVLLLFYVGFSHCCLMTVRNPRIKLPRKLRLIVRA